MAKIALLDKDTASQIAAGEVVERPASVVKELVENSLDAGSHLVVVRLEEGGLAEIQVQDDGNGMEREDALLAFQRHATSKIRSLEDLLLVRSLGFRGEALPSIAAVSKVELLSRERAALEGVRVVVEGGQVLSCDPAGCAPGTVVTVHDLFYNTPARRKYLKSPAAEGTAVADLLTRLALANPGVAFRLFSSKRMLLETSGNNTLLDTVASLYGLEAAHLMVPVEASGPWFAIRGVVGRPELSKGSRHGETILVNSRYVHSPALARALEEAYHTLLPAHRFPMAVLSLEVDPARVDVNVHPAKLSIRLEREGEVSTFLEEAVRRVLARTRLAPQWHPAERASEDYLPARQEGAVVLEAEQATWQLELPPAEAPEKIFPVLSPLAQIKATYILAEGSGGLYIIDQHAAHERVLFEELQKQAREGNVKSQALLLPVTVELSPEVAGLLAQAALYLNELGITVEYFGKNTFLLRAMPAGAAGEPLDFLNEALELWKESRNRDPVKLKEESLKLLACHAAIRAGQILNRQEMDGLLSRLKEAALPFTCPHGRPTIIFLSGEELARRFRRG